MVFRVQRQHPVAERAFEPRQRALQHREARARDLGRGREIHQAERLAELEMLLRLEGEGGHVAVLVKHDVGGFVAAFGDFGVEGVGETFEQKDEVSLGTLRLLRNLGLALLGACDPCHEFAGVLAATTRRADLLGHSILHRAQLF